MRIWIITQSNLNRPGGVSTHVHWLQKGLIENGHEVTLITSTSNYNFLMKLFLSLPIRMLQLFQKGLGIEYALKFHANIIYIKAALLLLKGEAPEVFACQDIIAINYLIKLRKQFKLDYVPILLSSHACYYGEKIEQGMLTRSSKSSSKVYEWEKRAIHSTEGVVVVSNALKKTITTHYGVTKFPITVLHNAIDIDQFVPFTVEEKISARKRYEIPQTSFVCVIGGKVCEQKGIKVVVEAVKQVKELRPDINWLLVIAGDGLLRRWVTQKCQLYKLINNIKILGNIQSDEMPMIIAMSDMVLMPSLDGEFAVETLGMTAIEASSCAVPVIASRCGGLPEVVFDGINGLLTEPGSVDSLVNAMIKLADCTELAINLGLNGRKLAENKYDYKAYAKQFFEIVRPLTEPVHQQGISYSEAAVS